MNNEQKGLIFVFVVAILAIGAMYFYSCKTMDCNNSITANVAKVSKNQKECYSILATNPNEARHTRAENSLIKYRLCLNPGEEPPNDDDNVIINGEQVEIFQINK